MAETFNQAGIEAEALDSTTPLPERRNILNRLRTGETRVLANCAVLTEGFDEPSVDCIIIARPTRSRPFYQQMLGRGTRTYPVKRLSYSRRSRCFSSPYRANRRRTL